MGRSNKPNPNIGGKLGLVAGIVSAVTPVAIEFIDRIPRKDETEPSEELISMPELTEKLFELRNSLTNWLNFQNQKLNLL